MPATAVILAGSPLLTSCGGSSDGGAPRLWHYEDPDSAMAVAWDVLPAPVFLLSFRRTPTRGIAVGAVEWGCVRSASVAVSG
ncbi:hypothetical protein [Streptomyces kebangsaanensis]|uniref:hypothetical protein n=1 Tax=Streptomyces kebangsaanensis TaxID=864058 RepID=UPI0009393255|nr:hypothetical protein [Streptomyces kebangsaanensis]